MLPHAPGVQMQAIPEDAVPDDTVDEDTEDPDKRLSSKTSVRFHTAAAAVCLTYSKTESATFKFSLLCDTEIRLEIVPKEGATVLCGLSWSGGLHLLSSRRLFRVGGGGVN